MFDKPLAGTIQINASGEFFFKHNKTDLKYVIKPNDASIPSLRVGDNVDVMVDNCKGEVRITKIKEGVFA